MVERVDERDGVVVDEVADSNSGDSASSLANFVALIFSALVKASLLFFHFLSPSLIDAMGIAEILSQP